MTASEKKPRQEPWQFQDAKARLSEVLDRANEEGPQFIKRRGGKGGVLLSDDEYLRLRQRGMTIAEALAGAPGELPWERDNRPVVPIDLE